MVMVAALAMMFMLAVVPTLVMLSMVPVMVAMDIRIVVQFSVQQSFYRLIRLAGYPSIKLNFCLFQRVFRTAADTSTNQHINSKPCQKSCQSTMPAAIGIYNLLPGYLSIRNVIDFKLLRVAEMLENPAVFIGNRNFHR